MHETLINEDKWIIPKYFRRPDVIGGIATSPVDLANHKVKARTIFSIGFSQDWKFWALLFPVGDILFTRACNKRQTLDSD